MNREKLIKQKQYEEKLEEEKKLKISRMVEIENLNLSVISALKDYITTRLCIKCHRDKLIFKINSKTGEVYGECLTCGTKNTLSDLLLLEKKLIENYEARRKLKEANMIKCPYCAELIDKKSEKCNKCGAKIK